MNTLQNVSPVLLWRSRGCGEYSNGFGSGEVVIGGEEGDVSTALDGGKGYLSAIILFGVVWMTSGGPYCCCAGSWLSTCLPVHTVLVTSLGLSSQTCFGTLEIIQIKIFNTYFFIKWYYPIKKLHYEY